MTFLSNAKYRMELSARGAMQSLIMQEDPAVMNWVVDPVYLQQAGYEDEDKLFGEWTLELNGKIIRSVDLKPIVIQEGEHRAAVEFDVFR